MICIKHCFEDFVSTEALYANALQQILSRKHKSTVNAPICTANTFLYFSKSRIKVNRIWKSNYLDGKQQWSKISATLLPFFTMINSFRLMADPFKKKWMNIFTLCRKKSIFMYRRVCEPIVQVILTTCVNIIATAWAYILSVTEVSLPKCFSSLLLSPSSLSTAKTCSKSLLSSKDAMPFCVVEIETAQTSQ